MRGCAPAVFHAFILGPSASFFFGGKASRAGKKDLCQSAAGLYLARRMVSIMAGQESIARVRFLDGAVQRASRSSVAA